MSPQGAALRTLMDWAAQLCLCEVDASMRARLCTPQSKAELLTIQPDLQAWYALSDKEAIAEGQEAYATAFLLPQGPGVRLAGFTQGDTERLGPAMADELSQLLAALGKGPDTQRFGKLPIDHAAIALSALGALAAQEPPLRVSGLQEAHFFVALREWAGSLSKHPRVHPLYQALGKVCQATIEDVLQELQAIKSDRSFVLPVLQ